MASYKVGLGCDQGVSPVVHSGSTQQLMFSEFPLVTWGKGHMDKGQESQESLNSGLKEPSKSHPNLIPFLIAVWALTIQLRSLGLSVLAIKQIG